MHYPPGMKAEVSQVPQTNAGAIGLVADCHTHLLHGLDDGAQNEEETSELLGLAAASGTKILFLTPHYLPGHFQASPEQILTAAAAWQEMAAGLGLELVAGQEAYLDPGLPTVLADGRVLPLGRDRSFLLVELPLDHLPSWAGDVLFQLQLKGATPILAHPERCSGVVKQPEWLEQAVSRGMLVQLNGPSLTGAYGPLVEKTAKNLLRRGLVHFLGSDAHSSHRPPVLGAAVEVVASLVGPEAARYIAWENPLALLSGGQVVAPAATEAAATAPRHPFRRFFSWNR